MPRKPVLQSEIPGFNYWANNWNCNAVIPTFNFSTTLVNSQLPSHQLGLSIVLFCFVLLLSVPTVATTVQYALKFILYLHSSTQLLALGVSVKEKRPSIDTLPLYRYNNNYKNKQIQTLTDRKAVMPTKLQENRFSPTR